MAANLTVRMRRETAAACMTCPICHKLFRDATTVSECLHTFCRKCIYDKLSDEGLDCCPVCNIDLGCTPLEKLRPDHNLQDIRAKLFPSRREDQVNAQPEVVKPVRRKEISLSSLGVSTPRMMIAETATNGNGSRVIAQKLFVAGEPHNGDTHHMNPLDCLVEAANRSKYAGIPESPRAPDSEGHIRKRTAVDQSRSKKVGKTHVEGEAAPRESGISAQTVLDASTARGETTGPIWFSLIASEDQNDHVSLPQIPRSYLRIRNGNNLTVSFLQKYLMKKLQLSSEHEVELKFLGESLLPTLELMSLVDHVWVQCPPTPDTVVTSVGSSAKEFVMALTYSRRVSV